MERSQDLESENAGNGQFETQINEDKEDLPKKMDSGRNSDIVPTEEEDEPDYVTVEIKKNQFDATAGIIYSNGVSLIHWALGFGMFFIKWPDIEKAK